MTALRLDNVSRHFGGVRAVHGVSLDVAEGERRVLLGPNGAGKTTLFNLIGGQVRPSAGRIALFGRDVTRTPARRRTRLGLARTFQITTLFSHLTVEENLLLAVQALHISPFAMHRPVRSYAGVVQRTQALLERWQLASRRTAPVSALSYGEQRQLEIAMALAHEPRLLLLDEPTAGLSPAETAEVTAILRSLPRRVTVLLIEHDMEVAFGLADRVTILHQGSVIADGAPAEIRDDRRVQELYFGGETG